MVEIISKRHSIKFYLALVIICLLFLLMATLFLNGFLEQRSNNYLYPKDYLLLVLSILAYCSVPYFIYAHFKNAPIIKVNAHSITINREELFWSDIVEIELVGKRKVPSIIGKDYAESAAFSFKNGTTKVIFDDMYANTWQIKSFIQMVIIDKMPFSTSPNTFIDKDKPSLDFFDTFKGNQLTSFRGILLWAFIIFINLKFFIFTSPLNLKGLPYITGFSVVFFMLFSYQMYYFEVSDNYLVIRNHNFFWIRKAYRIDQLKEIVFETKGKLPNCLRVITKDFKYNFFPACTLHNEDWLAFKNKLETYHIKVRNECIPDPTASSD